MMCYAMRERMLEAEIEELEGRGTSLLAAHVRECEECGAVARGIVRDTRVLAAVLARESFAGAGGGRGVGRAYLMIGAAAAMAASVVFLAPRDRRSAPDATPSVVEVPAVIARIGDTVELRALPLQARRFADAIPVASILLAPSAEAPPRAVDEPTMVRVDPPAGVGAAVMQTSNPSITVVVLYPTSSGMKR